jgi:hypothetical protein
VPIPDLDWSGNRRPAVDGFLVFANVRDKFTYAGSALVVLRLASAGETVDVASLRVEQNGNDVTGMFAWSDQHRGYAATFAWGSSPIQPGPNVLRTSIQGIVPGATGQRATDTDRLTFDFRLRSRVRGGGIPRTALAGGGDDDLTGQQQQPL